MAVKDWSTTAASNTGIISGITLDGAVMTPPQVDNAFRDFAAQIASQLGKDGYKGSDIASASPDLSAATGWYVDVTGTTAITALGTVDAGQLRILKFEGALTLTHNASSLILPGAANITTADGDVALMMSEGSGNWRCLAYVKGSGAIAGGAGTVGAPTYSFASDPDTGMYRYSADGLGLGVGGVLTLHISNTAVNVGRVTSDGTTIGSSMQKDGQCLSVVAADTNWITNRTGSDGTVWSIRNDGSTVGTVSVSGATTSYNTSSDKRLKTNWAAFDAGPLLDALDVWRYQWKLNDKFGYGILAQDAANVFPDAIHYDEKTDLWTADYSKFVPLLLAEVKALRARVAALEA